MRFGIARKGTRRDSTPISPSSTSSDEVRDADGQNKIIHHKFEQNSSLTDLEWLIKASSPRRSYADAVRGSPSIGSSTPNSNMSISIA